MRFSEEHMKLIKQACQCLEKVADDIPFEAEDEEVDLFYQAFLKLSAITKNEHS